MRKNRFSPKLLENPNYFQQQNPFQHQMILRVGWSAVDGGDSCAFQFHDDNGAVILEIAL